jgi:hypothetical protein
MRSKLGYTAGQMPFAVEARYRAESAIIPCFVQPHPVVKLCIRDAPSGASLSDRSSLSASTHEQTLVPFKANQGSFRPIPVDTRSDGYVVVQGNI